MLRSSLTRARIVLASIALLLAIASSAVFFWHTSRAPALSSHAADAAVLAAREHSVDDAPLDAATAGAPDAGPTACDLARTWNNRILADALLWAKAHATSLGRKDDPIDEELARLASLETAYREHEAGPGAMTMLERDRARLEQKRARRDGGDMATLPSLDCFADAKGAWAVIFEEAEYVPASPSTEKSWVINGTLAIARFDRARIVGRRVLVTYMTAGGEREDGFEHTTNPNCCELAMSDGYTLSATFDVDHDGVPEAVVTSGMHPDGSDVRTIELLSARGGDIVVVATDFDGLDDYDGDGEADLAHDLLVSFELCDSQLRSEGTSKGLRFIDHGLGNGVFDRAHPRAKVYALDQCPKVPTSFDTVESVLCGRLQKINVDTMKRWIVKHYGDPRCDDGHWVDEKGAPRAPGPAPALLAALHTPLPFPEP